MRRRGGVCVGEGGSYAGGLVCHYVFVCVCAPTYAHMCAHVHLWPRPPVHRAPRRRLAARVPRAHVTPPCLQHRSPLAGSLCAHGRRSLRRTRLRACAAAQGCSRARERRSSLGWKHQGRASRRLRPSPSQYPSRPHARCGLSALGQRMRSSQASQSGFLALHRRRPCQISQWEKRVH